MSETSSVQTKQNRKQHSTVKLIKQARQVKFLSVKIEKFVGGNSRQSFVCPVSGMLGGGIYKCPFLQVGYNRNDHFRYFLVARVRLIEVST